MGTNEQPTVDEVKNLTRKYQESNKRRVTAHPVTNEE